MLFDARAVLAEILQSETPTPATPATTATQAPKPAPVSQASQVSQGGASSIGKTAAPSAPADPNPRQGCMVRLAWSGEWVTADRYATMTDRERHGPHGKLWCGKCARERDRETALRCLDGEACQ